MRPARVRVRAMLEQPPHHGDIVPFGHQVQYAVGGGT
jgi:hypothetical protein